MPRFCPKCGTQVLDEKSLFCSKCGTKFPEPQPDNVDEQNCQVCHTERVPDSKFCHKCGAPFGRSGTATKRLVEKPVIEPKVNQTIEFNNKIKEHAPIKSPEKPSIATTNVMSLLLRLAAMVIFLYIGISLIGPSNLGLDNLNFGNIFQSHADVPITQDLSSMALTINDLPTGWIGGGNGGTENKYSAEFLKTSVYSPGMVMLDITRYPNINKAEQEYNSLKSQAPNYVKLETINVGNEGFGYIDATDVWVIFRRGNIIVKIEDVRNEYEFYATINNAKKFAEIVANRIKQ